MNEFVHKYRRQKNQYKEMRKFGIGDLFLLLHYYRRAYLDDILKGFSYREMSVKDWNKVELSTRKFILRGRMGT